MSVTTSRLSNGNVMFWIVFCETSPSALNSCMGGGVRRGVSNFCSVGRLVPRKTNPFVNGLATSSNMAIGNFEVSCVLGDNAQFDQSQWVKATERRVRFSRTSHLPRMGFRLENVFGEYQPEDSGHQFLILVSTPIQ
jgi:hypothetical protein